MSASHTLTVARGDGLVARFGDVVMYIAEINASAPRLLAAIESVAGTEHPGAAVAQRLATIAFGPESTGVAPFGVIAPTADGLLVLLRGNVAAEIDGAQGTRRLSGERAFTWVDEIVPASVRQVAITRGGGSRLSGCPNTDLREGVVPGGGFLLYRAGAKADRPSQPESVVPEAVPISSIDEPMQRARSPAHTAAAMKAAPSPAHTAPSLSLPAETATVASVGGVLASEEGAVYPLDRPYVIGRDPLNDEAVRGQMASPIVVHNDPHISRVHAHVSLDGGKVLVRDASTPGGTFIAAPGAEDWTQIGTTPTELRAGWSLRIGELVLTYRTGS